MLQMSSTWLMPSTNIALRSASRLPKASESERNPPGLMPNRKRPSRQVIHHRHGRGHGDGMAVRHVDRAGPQFDRLRLVDQAGQEHQARGHRFGDVGRMLADECFGETQFVGQDDRLAVFLQNLRVVRAGGCKGMVKKESFIGPTSQDDPFQAIRALHRRCRMDRLLALAIRLIIKCSIAGQGGALDRL